jgi:endonuclease/exonuclease/phosphatase family metal-dependent hydrolase
MSPLVMGVGLHLHRDNYLHLDSNPNRASVFSVISNPARHLENIRYGDTIIIQSNKYFLKNGNLLTMSANEHSSFKISPVNSDFIGKELNYGDPFYLNTEDNTKVTLSKNNSDLSKNVMYLSNDSTASKPIFYFNQIFSPFLGNCKLKYNSGKGIDTIKIIEYNIWMFPDLVSNLINVSPNKTERAKEIIKIVSEYDIVIFTELFCDTIRNFIINELRKYGFYYNTQCLGNGETCRKAMKMNGGIVIISKYLILESDTLLFHNISSGDDSFANKGAVYSKIIINNVIIDLFGCHLQAWRDNVDIRQQQLLELNKFIKSKASKNDYCIIAGDFNVDKSSNIDEYRSMLNILNSTDLIDSPAFTINAKNNLLARGNTLSNDGSSEIVDYILNYNKSKKINLIESGVLHAKASESFDYNDSKCYDISDHYPVFVKLKLN